MRISYWVHAIERMHTRGLSTDDIRHVLESGQVIEEYPDNSDSPGRLMLGMRGERPVHVVAAAAAAGHTVIITAYEPDPEEWEPGYKHRRR
jgi:hypothetical protein